MNKENMVNAYSGIISTLKREGNSYNTTWMSPEEHMLSELSRSQDCGSLHTHLQSESEIHRNRDPDSTHKMVKLVSFT